MTFLFCLPKVTSNAYKSITTHLLIQIQLQLFCCLFALGRSALCRVAMWVEHSFGTENGVQQGPQEMEAHFMSLRDGRPLTISMQGTKVSLQVLQLD